jgi:hypothetical protein
MKEYDLQKNVLKTLNQFENLESIDPDEGWYQTLMRKVESEHQSNSVRISVSKFALITMFILLINIGFILNTIIRDSKQPTNHDAELNAISKEFLINPGSINY